MTAALRHAPPSRPPPNPHPTPTPSEQLPLRARSGIFSVERASERSLPRALNKSGAKNRDVHVWLSEHKPFPSIFFPPLDCYIYSLRPAIFPLSMFSTTVPPLVCSIKSLIAYGGRCTHAGARSVVDSRNFPLTAGAHGDDYGTACLRSSVKDLAL